MLSWRMRRAFRSAVAGLGLFLCVGSGQAQNVAEEGLKEVRFSDLSSTELNALGQAALALRRDDWKHAETENFILHFLDGPSARQVGVEAEFYFRVIAKDLDKTGVRAERKAKVFIFDPGTWADFKRTLNLDPLTGGAHLNGELFLSRTGEQTQGPTLGHEIAHLVLERFYGSRAVPLWLNEGYAEYISNVLYAAFYRARKYNARPRLPPLQPEDFIPIEQLTGFTRYPVGDKAMIAFYIESQRLVAFLQAGGKENFRAFLEAITKGSYFESALDAGYGGRFGTRHELEEKFKAELFKTP